jgi:acyl transferase domain-containing protein/acyl carrier protein
LWRSWGIEPDAVIGHSMGEVAAAHVAGALGLEDAARIICRRSRLLRRTSGQGAMALVELSLEQAQEALNGYEDRVSIAVSNSSRSTVLSGDRTALEAIINRLDLQAVFSSWVKVDVASHSPQMDPLRADLLHALDDLQPGPVSIPIYSTLTGQAIDGLQLGAQYWVRNLREPVLFSTAVRRLLKDGHDVFIEISPHPILLPAIQQELQQLGHEGTVLPSLRREEEEQAVMLGSLGALYTRGCPIDWSRLYPTGGRCVRVPSYPWQRERFWCADQKAKDGRSLVRSNGSTGHPLLGQHLRSSIHAGTHFWETELSADGFPYLADHRIHGQLILPAAAYVEMAAAAATEIFGAGPHLLEKVAFSKALVLPKDGAQTVQLVIFAEMPGSASFRLLSRQPGDAEHQASWTVHATGTISLRQRASAEPLPQYDPPEEIQARCSKTMSGTQHYQGLALRGLEHGAAFQGVAQLWRQDKEAIARLCLPETVAAEAHAYQVHPALLDACFQTLVAALPPRDDGTADGDTYVPIGLDSLRVYDRPDPAGLLWAYARHRQGGNGNVDTFEGDVYLLDAEGKIVLEAQGLRLQHLKRNTPQDLNDWLYNIRWQPAARPKPEQLTDLRSPAQPGIWLIFADGHGVGATLASLLQRRGDTCVIALPGEAYKRLGPGHYELDWANPEEFQRLLKDALGADRPSCRGVVHLWSLDAVPPEETSLASLDASQGLGCCSVLYTAQALAQADWQNSPRLWVVTRAVQAVGEEAATVSVAQAPVWGLGAVISNEHPELHCTRVSLSLTIAPEEIQSLFDEICAGDSEEQVALRGNARYVARLVRWPSEAGQMTPPEASAEAKSMVAASGQNYRIEISTPGILDHLTLRPTGRLEPGPGEVEIQVHAAGLNFLDVLKAMGIYSALEPGAPIALGAECTGKITAVGKGVENLLVGDEVVAISPSFSRTSLFSAFVTIPAHLVIPKPTHLSSEEAAAIPITFLTAYYALHHLGRLSQGERVLIHAAAGGVGLAAVQLAQRAGAEIFATAGNEEKREFLRSLGIQHTMDSRSLAFADEVMECTGGEGVDIVLNSLVGEAIPKSLAILKPYGRFLEIGKRDIYQNSQIGLGPFKNNLSFFAIDLARLVEERPAFMTSLFREVMQYFEHNTLHAPPFQIFPISEVASAFRCMAQARHIGKIVVSLQAQEVLIAPAREEPTAFRSDGTYLITGGLGGLGLTVAQWMVRQGARHLVLVGRSGASVAAQAVLDAMQEAGAEVVVATADVAREEQVARLLSSIGQSMPPLRGVIHAAGILDDGILLHLNRERLQAVMAPKMSGAWNLHALTLNEPIDFFVLFSSVVSCLGSPGQGNYAAANAFLDALAQYRRSQGRPALSINWGPWSGVGLAAAQSNRGERLMGRGLESITPEQGIDVLGQLLRQDVAQVAVMPFHLQQWCRFYPTAAASPLFATLAQEWGGKATPSSRPPHKEGGIRQELLRVAPGRMRRSLLESYLQAQVAQVLQLAPSRIDVYKPLRTMGLDSLMSLELRNRLEVGLGLTLSATLTWNYPTIAVLASHLAGMMGIPLEDTAEPKAKESVQTASWQEKAEEIDRALRDIEQLSEDNARRLLAEGSS